jgi:hypothetical protein
MVNVVYNKLPSDFFCSSLSFLALYSLKTSGSTALESEVYSYTLDLTTLMRLYEGFSDEKIIDLVFYNLNPRSTCRFLGKT